ncbi:hypothetical protein JZ751_017518 [Albula glossodonta]|uniref:Transmembrane protein 51 n=1 Tax=Albula glossodonta TaxID=121402 RepID=A0A8T2PNK1_9TELE|nr:hypothetical protein JZ751_017518 [Albula glossodonta]
MAFTESEIPNESAGSFQCKQSQGVRCDCRTEEMCSSGHLCRGGDRPSSRSGSGSSSGSQYALCALGVGLVALGIVMIVWSVVPAQPAGNNSSVSAASGEPGTETEDTDMETRGKTSSVAFVLVGAGLAMLLLAICLSVRNKHRQPQRREVQVTDSAYQQPGETEEDPLPRYDVPSYEEAVGSGQYPVRQSNLRNSTSQLPSYEDLLQAVENEGAEPGAANGQDPPQSPPTPAGAATEPTPEAQPAPEPQPTPDPPPAPPTRHSSRSSRILRPLRVRRIKSEKLHLKDFRLNIRNPAQAGPVNIEPLTPPPQYDDKAPEF